MLSFEFSDIVFDGAGDARTEIAHGNYEYAAELAGRAGDEELAGVAVLMAGAVGQGLDRLANIFIRYPETHLYKAFGHWCRNETEAALASLDKVTQSDHRARADGLRTLIRRPRISVTVIADANNARGAALNPGEAFAVRHITTAAERDGLVDSPIPLGGDLLLVYDSATPALIEKARRDGVNSAVLGIDLDQQWGALFDVLRDADVIVGENRLEHHMLQRIFDTRIVSFPFLTVREHRGRVSKPLAGRDIDVFCSGNNFVPHWPDKARILYRIAAIDDAALNIVINHGYLEDSTYRAHMRRAKFVPLTTRFGFCINQDRTTEALHDGACGLAFDGVAAHWILSDAGHRLRPLPSRASEDELRDAIRTYDALIAVTDDERFEKLVCDFYPPPPERDARMLKFVLFQTLFKDERTLSARIDNDPVRVGLARVSADCFNAFSAEPTSRQLQQATLDAFAAESDACPQAIIPPYNRARAMWMMGRQSEAAALFAYVLEMPAVPGVCIPGEAILPHRIRALSGLMPYHAYYQSMVMDCADGDSCFARIHAVIRATCLTYLSLHHSQQSHYAEAAKCAGRALALCDRHHPAAWQLIKASFAGNMPPQHVLRAFLAATELYPPLIDELLPFGVHAMEQLGLSDLAEFTVRRWAYTLLRITYSGADKRTIPQQSYDCAMRYFSRLPAPLQAVLKAKI